MTNFLLAEEGQGMAEYGLILGVVAIGAVAILAIMREQIVDLYKQELVKIGIASQ